MSERAGIADACKASGGERVEKESGKVPWKESGMWSFWAHSCKRWVMGQVPGWPLRGLLSRPCGTRSANFSDATRRAEQERALESEGAGSHPLRS